jgi:hypothetical protein
MFTWALDTAIVNAFILHSLTVSSTGIKDKPRSTLQMYFRCQLVDELLERAQHERVKQATADIASAAAVHGHGLGVTRPLKKHKPAGSPRHVPTFVVVVAGQDGRKACEMCGMKCTAKCDGCYGNFFCCSPFRNCFELAHRDE